MDEFKVTTERFSGPYTRLLEMIEERKLSITEVSLSSVADEYISYVQNLDKKDYLDISAFVVVAATLMLIKVKSLLPGIAYTETEEKQIHELETKLALHSTCFICLLCPYRLSRKVTKHLTRLWNGRRS